MIHLSEVKYIDYNTESISDSNTLYPVVHKQKAYNYEDEVRLIHGIFHKVPSLKDLVYDWSKEEVDTGFYVPTNIDKLITEIVISPHAPNWFFKMVEGLTEVYGLDKPVRKSSLTPP